MLSFRVARLLVAGFILLGAAFLSTPAHSQPGPMQPDGKRDRGLGCPPKGVDPIFDINGDGRLDWWTGAYWFQREGMFFLVDEWCLNDPLNVRARGRNPLHMYALYVYKDGTIRDAAIV
jgi:hypothetical protein